MSRMKSRSHVLLVEDSVVQARHIERLLSSAGFQVTIALDGEAALQSMSAELPDVVLTDLRMPGLDGLGLVQKVRCKYPGVPVVLMTAHGNEEIAVEALQKGAASYIPKRSLENVVVGTLRRLIELARTARSRQRILASLQSTAAKFELENDHALIPPLIAYLQECFHMLAFCDETDLIRISTALNEALVNAMDHGNLELSSCLREGIDDEAYYELRSQRRRTPPYCDRRVHVFVDITRERLLCVVRDEGPGFNPRALPNPHDPSNLERISGRGLLLIHTFMDEVYHNETGNEIRMIKYRSDSQRKPLAS